MGLFPRQTILVGADLLRVYRAPGRTGGRSSLDTAQILAGSRRRLAPRGRRAGPKLEHVALRQTGAIARRVWRALSEGRRLAAFFGRQRSAVVVANAAKNQTCRRLRP